MRNLRLCSLFVAFACAAIPLSFADQVVYFVNGKAIMAKSVEKGPKFTVLEVEGGGRIGVPTEQIVRIEEYVVSAPAAVIAAPPAAAIVPQPVAQAPTAGGAAPGMPQGARAATPMLPGPGMGGHPLLNSNQSMAGLNALEMGGAVTPAPSRPAQAGPGLGGIGPNGASQNYAVGRRGGGGRGYGRATRVLTERGRGPAPVPVTAAPVQAPAAQPPAPTVEPEEAPQPPDEPNEEPSDPEPPEGEPSGNTPGGAS